jgi:hypothetical protein
MRDSSRAAVVFVHGLSGDAFRSWQADGEDSSFWPRWLAADLPGLAVYTLSYDAEASNWFGSAMQLPDRATEVLALLESHGLDRRPVVFVCHSLGGLLVKQVLRIASDRHAAAGGPGIFARTRGVAFLGTPNMGSHLSDWAERFRMLLRPTEATESLKANDAYLRDLNIWYRDHVVPVRIATLACFETRTTHGVMVVEAMSADPGIPGVRPIPIDADHIGICKPASRETTLYRTVHRFITDACSDSARLRGRAAAGETPPAQQLDVFISYASGQREWVEALANNLQSAGKSVFFDVWRLVPGQDFIQGLRAGLASCRSAILVVSPEALQSGWVREEYEILNRRRDADPAFRVVPVVHSGTDFGTPFYGSIQWVDFRDPSQHRTAFARLLAGLSGDPPGSDPRYDGLWKPLPEFGQRPVATAEQQTIQQAFLKLLGNARVVVILAQEGLGSSAVVQELRTQAIESYGEAAVHHLRPAYVTPEDGPAPYFQSLLEQMHLPIGNCTAQHFGHELATWLENHKNSETMCLLFTGIEQSPPPILKSLCGHLRALTEQFNNLRVLMCGGERLCDLRYEEEALSLLNNAQEELWPDPDKSAIQAEATALDCGILDGNLIDLLWELTGGHLAVLRELLRRVRMGERSRTGFTELVMDSPAIWAAVAPVLGDNEASHYLRSIVDREALDSAPHYIRHRTLRRIYWRNLVKRRRSGDKLMLVWRSHAIRDAVRRIIQSS